MGWAFDVSGEEMLVVRRFWEWTFRIWGFERIGEKDAVGDAISR